MPNQPPARFCAVCGASRPTSAVFCPACGTSLMSDGQSGSIESPRDQGMGDSAVSRTKSSGRFIHLDRQGWYPIAAVGMAVALLVVGTFVFLARSSSEPALDALGQTHDPYAEVVTALAAVKTVDDVAVVATQAGQTSNLLDRAYADVRGRDGETAQKATAVLSAELESLQGLSRLSRLSETSLTSWSENVEQISASVTSYAASVGDLKSVEPQIAAEQPDLEVAWTAASGVVNSTVVGEASQETASALIALSHARTTSQVRKSAENALQIKTTLESSAAAVDHDVASTSSIAQMSAVLDAITPLTGLTVDALDVWKGTRPDLVSALTSIPSESTEGSPVGQAGDAALKSLDRVVRVADSAMREWRVDNASAIKARQSAVKILDTYDSRMRAQIRTYSALRGDTGDFIDRIESGAYVTFDDAYMFLDQAEWDRRAVRDAMNNLDVPTAMQDRHAALVSVIDRAISAIQAASDGTYDAQWCTSTCYWKDTPGWRTFHTESSAISTEYASSLASWETALSAAHVAAEHLPLPPKPRV